MMNHFLGELSSYNWAASPSAGASAATTGAGSTSGAGSACDCSSAAESCASTSASPLSAPSSCSRLSSVRFFSTSILLPPLPGECMGEPGYAAGQQLVHNLKVRGKREHRKDHNHCGRLHLFTARPRHAPHFELQLVDIILHGL